MFAEFQKPMRGTAWQLDASALQTQCGQSFIVAKALAYLM
jgi:hypothetical protein